MQNFSKHKIKLSTITFFIFIKLLKITERIIEIVIIMQNDTPILQPKNNVLAIVLGNINIKKIS